MIKNQRLKSRTPNPPKGNSDPDWHSKLMRRMYSMRKKGRLKVKPCEVCGELKVEGHHMNYSKPNIVTWLCKKHHVEWHYKHRSVARMKRTLIT